MPEVWVESASASFQCRHKAAQAADAERVLAMLERMRARLERSFPRTVGQLTVVLHDSSASLYLANPALALRWARTAPAARRYVAGWVGRDELHVLAPTVLSSRASRVRGSAQMLERAPASLYARRVVVECNHQLHRARGLPRMRLEARWAWMLEGAARYFSGETAHARGAIVARLSEGGRPRFPPTARDASLLGGTVIDLLVTERGEVAAVNLAGRLHPGGPRAALVRAFDRPLVHTEGAWRAHLARLAGG